MGVFHSGYLPAPFAVIVAIQYMGHLLCPRQEARWCALSSFNPQWIPVSSVYRVETGMEMFSDLPDEQVG